MVVGAFEGLPPSSTVPTRLCHTSLATLLCTRRRTREVKLRVTQLGPETESLSVADPDGFQVPRRNALVLVKGCQLLQGVGRVLKAFPLSQALIDPVKLSVAMKGTFPPLLLQSAAGTSLSVCREPGLGAGLLMSSSQAQRQGPVEECDGTHPHLSSFLPHYLMISAESRDWQTAGRRGEEQRERKPVHRLNCPLCQPLLPPGMPNPIP